MKTRLSLLLPVIVACLFGSAAVAQTISAPDPGPAISGFAAQVQSLYAMNDAGPPLPEPAPQSTAGESSSRRHSTYKGNGAGGSSTAAQPCTQPPHRPWFSLRLQMTTVPAGQNICPLDFGGKFDLFARTTLSPFTFATAGAAAGWSQWQNDDAEWGQGAEGYGKRYAAAYTDRAAKSFFGKFFYPVIFRQDPRYFRESDGGFGHRLGHAMAHTFVARSDSGHSTPNISLWAAATSTVALENLYHPGNERGFEPAARRTGISLGISMGYDILKEFWPDIARKFGLPGHKEQPKL